MKLKYKAIILGVCFLGVGFLSFKIGVFVGEENILKTPPPQLANENEGKVEEVDFSIFWESWRKLERNYLNKKEIDYQAMVYGAIKGMVGSLDDPYTTFFKPKESKDFDEELSGKYEGVGMEITIRNGKLTVVSPFEGSPAQEAGLKPGDAILEVGGVSTEDLPIEESVEMIKGPEGTKVILTVQRSSWAGPKEIEVQREVIKIPTLSWELLESEIALIKIYQFNAIVGSEFKKAALEILASGAEGVIVDLRNNPGGFLDMAEDIAGWFVEKGEIIVIQDFGEGKERQVYKSRGPSSFFGCPTVVLINQGSASGAEILAGALRDRNEAKLVGETSFGKGSVQEKISLSDDSSLKITIAKWLTPNGSSIDEVGLSPDFEVELTEDDWDNNCDPQLEKAIEVVKSLK